MAKISSSPNVQSSNDLPTLVRLICDFCKNVFNALNGNIRFQDNMKCQLVSVNFSGVSSNTTVFHNLNSNINGFIVYNQTAGGVVMRGNGVQSNQYVVLQATVPGTYEILLFV